ncbi:ABC transporter substrate-binding protein [Occultella kanbiaonis]|uniref:ABC transporter substrate-binding protein n=1 Tax=Occultella kanbiaonis TaxID=2675754 RepID=UPI0012B824B8|nr:ABC transporter substrate-binding protein [Occultella kanbiaonis]
MTTSPELRPSRRTLLIGASLAAVTTGLAACTPRSPATGSAPDTGAEPVPGGVLRAAFAGGGAQETLDPHRANLFLEGSRSKMIFEKLADLGEDMSAVPRLAQEWEPSADLTQWTIRLREAVFHDGRPVRPEDVLYSYRRIKDPAEGFRARSNFAMLDLDASEVLDERTLRLHLTRSYAEFPNSLAAFGAFIVPEDTTNFDEPIGSGPFRFAGWDPGRSLTLDAFDEYWEGRPYLDRLEYLIANEESARINALVSGTVQYAHDVSGSTAQTYAARDDLAFIRLPNSGMNGFAMKTDRAPFDHPDARRALFALADRQELVDAALGGAGDIGNDLFGKGYEYYADDLPQREQDLDLARRLIASSGLGDHEIVIDTADAGSGLIASANVFADQLRAAGLTASVRQRDAGTYWSEILDEGILCAYRSGGMPIESHVSQRLLSDSSTNATAWRDPAFDALYADAIATADPAVRAGIYHDMQATLHDRGGFLIWGFADWIVATSANVGGIVEAPANSLDWARFDRVWLA